MIRKVFIWLFCAITIWTQSSCENPKSESPKSESPKSTYSYPLKHLSVTGKKTGIAAYISKISRDNNSPAFIVSDYSNIYLFDYSSNTLKLIDVKYDEEFVPTGTSFDKSSGLLYIANYTGNNILVGRLDIESLELDVVSEIRDEQTISPEGVVAFDQYIASANFDGNNIQIFSKAGAKICQLPVKLAHGINYGDGYLFAASAYDSQILKIDVVNCNVVATTGSKGWERGQYQWPMSIAPQPGKILISDALTGKLTVLSTNSMEVMDHWGGNGPGAFNMPYAAEWDGDDILVVSTFNNLIFRVRGSKVIHAWTQETIENDSRSLEWVTDDGEYFNGRVRNETIEIHGKCYQPVYGYLKECGTLTKFPHFPRSNQSGFIYFVHAVRGKRGAFVFSPQNPHLYYYGDNGKCAPPIRMSVDMWAFDGSIVGNAGRIDHLSYEARLEKTLFDCSKLTGISANS